MGGGGLVEGDFERGARFDNQGARFVGEDTITVGHVVRDLDIMEVVIDWGGGEEEGQVFGPRFGTGGKRNTRWG